MKRIFIFLMINFIIVMTISSIISILNLQPYISHFGLNISSLLIFSFIWGMVGSFISLLFSKQIVKSLLKIDIINKNPNTCEKAFLINTIKELLQNTRIEKMPEIGIYSSSEINAFATGATKNSSLVAVSTGLLNKMNEEEIKAVLAHEISHIENGDMVTMTLLQGLVNAFVIFLARAAAFLISNRGKNKNNFSYFTFHLFSQIFQTIFMIFGWMGIAYFSRQREFRADTSGAKLVGKDKMIKALKSLQAMQNTKEPVYQKNIDAISYFKITNSNKKRASLFASHPLLSERIEKLECNPLL